MRDDIWLNDRLDVVWDKIIPEVERKNEVIIRFIGKWKNKFAHIKMLRNGSTEIAINSLFKYPDVPDFILETTIAHELIHYMHGFQSPHPQLFRHPHRGGIVDKEIKKRGYAFLFDLEKSWVKNNWFRLHSILIS
ncbi:hypothetical protein HON86_03035 [Candidatus Woesearchaeota archaeon]|nr:hypothetical protein [Candidatus Woesearchaeota archaeon]